MRTLLPHRLAECKATAVDPSLEETQRAYPQIAKGKPNYYFKGYSSISIAVSEEGPPWFRKACLFLGAKLPLPVVSATGPDAKPYILHIEPYETSFLQDVKPYSSLHETPE